MSELQKIKESNMGLMNQESAVLTSLQAALEKGVDADSLEKILNMQERILDRQAEQAYTQSMVAAQQEMPVIERNRTNDQTRSKYSDMEQILKTITPIYTKNGFALSFGNADSPHAGHVRVTCDVMHTQGHSKHYYTDTPLDMEGIKGNVNKTQVHGTGSAISYGQRYLTKLIFNLNTGDDDDGNAAGGDTRSALDITNEWIARMAIIRGILPSILAYKEAIQDQDYDRAVEAWSELTDDEKAAIYNPAPTKGGILTTPEREALKSNEMAAARNSALGS